MCSAADLDPCEVWQETVVKAARKEHRCQTCGRTIRVGESYHRLFSVFEGDASTEKSCTECEAAAVEFSGSHEMRGIPSYMPDMYEACVIESRDNGDEESAKHWQGVIDAIKERGA